MSNASNLSTLANVLDDGSDGQFLKSTGSGGVAFDTVAAGAVVYATADLLPLSGFAAGDMAYVTATNRFYINNGSGWYSISLVNTNPNITSVADAGSNTTPFTLATDQTATVVTITAADPEGVPLTYGYSVTSGSLNGSTVAQGTGSNSNVFTVTPHASQDATFTITFTASDGINQATSANAFSLSFVTVVTDSNHTTLLATATGTSDNNNITDSSSNSHSITVNGDSTAGSFSPYRSGGYSTFFNTATSHNAKIDLPTTVFNSYTTSNASTSNFTIQAMIYPTGYAESHSWGNSYAMAVFAKSVVRINLGINSSGYLIFHHYGTSANDIVGSSQVPLNEWSHVAIICTNGSLSLKLNGTQVGTGTWTGLIDPSASAWVGAHYYNNSNSSTGNNGYFKGYITDFKISSVAETITAAPTERLVSDSNTELLLCHLPYIADGSSNSVSVTPDDVSIKPFSPYDYNEYSATDHGGSIYFDGSGDYLTLGSGAVTIPSGDFTVEAWAYPTGTSSGANGSTVLCFGANNGVGLRIFWDVNGNHFRFLITGGSSTGAYIYDTNIETATPNAWYHVAAVRTNGVFKFFVNGVLQGTGNNSVTFEQSAFNLARIGYNTQNTYYWNGYISDVRYNNSTALYTSNDETANVPTAPLSSTNAELHLKGTDASIEDKSQGSNLKLVGNTTGSTTTKFTGAKSMYFDGSSDYLVVPASSEINFGTADFTVEFWINFAAFPSNGYILNKEDSSGNDFTLQYYQNAIKTSNATVGSGWSHYSSGIGSLSTGTWYHIAYCRSSGTLKSYKDGTQVNSATDSRNYNLNNAITLGSRYPGDYAANIYIQDLRITKGLARYTASDESSNIPSAPLEG